MQPFNVVSSESLGFYAPTSGLARYIIKSISHACFPSAVVQVEELKITSVLHIWLLLHCYEILRDENM